MEHHKESYCAIINKAHAAENEGLYHDAVELALSSWEHIDGMMQYARKYEDREFNNIESIDLVLKYSPFLFDFINLNKLENLLKDYRRIDKNTSESIASKLLNARELMWDAHKMWDYLEQHSEINYDELRSQFKQCLGRLRSTIDAWMKMGLIKKERKGVYENLCLITRLGQVISAKCTSCGAISEAPKAMFLEELNCLECRSAVLFIILPLAAKE